MSNLRLGRVQMKIMRIIWEKGRVNAREITETLNLNEPIAHSTVQTLLRKMEAKGIVQHEIDDRTFVFYPTVKEGEVKEFITHDLVERLFDGSVGELVSHLLKHEDVPRDELDHIRKLIDQQKRKDG